ncbi:MAG: putative addiction module antidote protein [Gemmatimonadaceae bacterium]|nr:putative addiction module antidote protein [Acetobacteraceae bacterium]
MTEAFSRFDAADYLLTKEDEADYLAAAGEDGDPAALLRAFATVARAHNMSQLARDADMTREGLYKALSVDGNPEFKTVAKIAGALGFAITFKIRSGGV